MPADSPGREQMRRARRRPLWTSGPQTKALALGREGIERMIPHRPPMLLLDVIDLVDLDQRAIRGARRIDAGDPVFAGHFPNRPVYPGIHLLEIMGQLGLCLYALGVQQRGPAPDEDTEPRMVDARLIRVHDAVFQESVSPGDYLTVYAQQVGDDGDDAYTAIYVGQIMRQQTVCAIVVLEVYLAGN